jgi:hypothetical protein
MSKKGKNRQIVDGEGDPCPRCGQPTEIREHKAITEKELRRPFYYSRWFNCTNPHCKTTLIVPERYVVWNDNEAAHALRQLREPVPPPEFEFDDSRHVGARRSRTLGTG